MATYQKVNLDVQPSSLTNGMDLPLSDINTLRFIFFKLYFLCVFYRFFFNFGVQHARAILLRQHIQSQNGQTGQSQQQIALLQAAQNVNQQQQNDQLLMQQNLLKYFFIKIYIIKKKLIKKKSFLKLFRIHNESVLSSTSSSINLQKTTPICINAISSITSCAGGSLTNNTASNSISSSAAAALAAVLQQRDISGSGGTNISITAANNSSIAINALQNSITHQVYLFLNYKYVFKIFLRGTNHPFRHLLFKHQRRCNKIIKILLLNHYQAQIIQQILNI